jgi:hypothetical protein
MDIQEKIRNHYTIAQDYESGTHRPHAPTEPPRVITPQGVETISPDVLSDQV